MADKKHLGSWECASNLKHMIPNGSYCLEYDPDNGKVVKVCPFLAGNRPETFCYLGGKDPWVPDAIKWCGVNNDDDKHN